WLKWRSMSGVLCDKNIPERLKSKIYRTVIRPLAIYGAECWPVTRSRSPSQYDGDKDAALDSRRAKEHRKQRWLDTLHTDLKSVNFHPDQAFNREKSRQHIRKADLANKRDKR
ncbi:hypothetical protein TELCIR_22792, partial [Teladorsagia circumcincta]